MSDTQAFLKEKKKSMAALYWGLALGAALVFFLIVAGLRGSDDYAAPDYDLELLEPVSAHSGSAEDITAVMLGNSRLRYGVTFGFDSSVPVELEDGRRLWAVQYAQNAGTFQHFKALWPGIIKARPDYIVIQSVIISANYNLQPRSLALFSNVTYHWLEKRLLGRDPREAWERARHDIRTSCTKEYTLAEIQNAIGFVAQRDRHDLEDNISAIEIREAIKEAIDAGIKVVILTIPPNEGVLKQFGVPDHVINRYGLGYTPTREQLLPELHDQVTWLDYQAPAIPYYCDISHLNEKGRVDFSDWLLTRLR